ncbi:hypothetical protein GGR54DRAFT_625737 [Hypoxylon sp. NC1633]|nr:hypothetical protein GGR54DRAFT_625737 [Hypoxylon sp. NC1633]
MYPGAFSASALPSNPDHNTNLPSMHRHPYTMSSSSGPPPPNNSGGYNQPSQPSYPAPFANGPPGLWNDYRPQPQQDRRNEQDSRGSFSHLRESYEDRYRPDAGHRDRDRDRDRDSYRPPQSDFTFRVEPPPGVDSYRPAEREQHGPGSYGAYHHHGSAHNSHGRDSYGEERNMSQPWRRQDERPAGRDGRDGRDSRPRRADDHRRQQRGQLRGGSTQRYRGFQKVKPSNRLLLHQKHDGQPELMLGSGTGRATYRDVDALSDSDEAEMDMSDNSDSGVAEPATKRVRTFFSASTKAEQEAPRWSNPDPYTALPPPDESARKKKDMVQLIRKARVEAEAKEPAAQIEGLDFISCDLSDDDVDARKGMLSTDGGGRNINQNSAKSSATNKATSNAISNAMNNVGRNNSQSRPWVNSSGNSSGIGPSGELNSGPSAVYRTGATISAEQPLVEKNTGNFSLPPKPPTPSSLYQSHADSSNNNNNNNNLTLKSTARGTRNRPVNLTASTSLGNRKRTFDDKIKLGRTSNPRAPYNMAGVGQLMPQWFPPMDFTGNTRPWEVQDHSATLVMSTRLHKELLDLHNYLRPRDFEATVRVELVKNLNKMVKALWPDAAVYPFGSFMSGLYLPTSDMDVSICSSSFMSRRIPRYDKNFHLYALQKLLKDCKAAEGDRIEVISKAKVPLVKYIDRETGLKVDISFENQDGHRAIKTFAEWKMKYPVMPILVSIIKHFLVMRGLNEPVSGGIGGFTVICMVVNLLNHMPQVQSKAMIPENHLGEVLMEFFDYYGNKFQFETVAIRMNPPGLVNKSDVSNLVYRNMDRFSIIDPNNPENDIAGGSKHARYIVKHFRWAFQLLTTRIIDLTWGGGDEEYGNELIGPLFAGFYDDIDAHRKQIKQLAARGLWGYDIPDLARKNEPRRRPGGPSNNSSW